MQNSSVKETENFSPKFELPTDFSVGKSVDTYVTQNPLVK